MSFLDKLLERFTPLFTIGAGACLAIALYQAWHFVAWPEVEANVNSVDFTCMAVKIAWWQKVGSHAYYPCDNTAEHQTLVSQGYTKNGSKTWNFVVQFKTVEGQLVSATISDFEQDLSDRDKDGRKKNSVVRIRYSKSSPEKAQFADVNVDLVRTFGSFAVIFGALAVWCRWLQRRRRVHANSIS